MNQPQPAAPQKSKTMLWVIIGIIILVILGFMMLSGNSSDEVLENDAVDLEGDVFEFEDDAGSLLPPDNTFNATTTTQDATTSADATVKTINLTGKSFEFSQEEIRVNQGDTVRVVFNSTQGFHDWVVDEFKAATEQVNP